jgi:hypothetical protein
MCIRKGIIWTLVAVIVSLAHVAGCCLNIYIYNIIIVVNTIIVKGDTLINKYIYTFIHKFIEKNV